MFPTGPPSQLTVTRSVTDAAIEEWSFVTYTCKVGKSYPQALIFIIVDGTLVEENFETESLRTTFQVRSRHHQKEVKCVAANQFGEAEAVDSFKVMGQSGICIHIHCQIRMRFLPF